MVGLFVYLGFTALDEQTPLTVPPSQLQASPSPTPSTPADPVHTPPTEEIEYPIIQIEQNDQAKPYCYIKEFNGRLSIYASKESPIPDIITDIPLSILPAADQDIIRQGFFVYSEADLSKILEDLGS